MRYGRLCGVLPRGSPYQLASPRLLLRHADCELQRPLSAVWRHILGSLLDTRANWNATDNAFQNCLKYNQKWAKETAEKDPEFFPKLAQGQAPEILWLGCSDARKPETTILGLKPGDVFTHRNIANIINPTDLSLLSVVEFAVRHIKVKHVVVCGHTSCGGVAATLANNKLGVLDLWLQPMRALREKHADELGKLEGSDKSTYMAKLNVKAGVENLRRMSTVIDAMKERGLQVHGVIYDLGTGLLDEVDCPEEGNAGEKRVAAFQTQ